MSRAATLPVLGPLAVVGLLGASCTLPAGYYCGTFLEEGVSVDGVRALLVGWMTFFLGHPEGLGWLANPVVAVALFRQWQKRFASAARWAATAMALGLLPLAVLLAGWWPSVRWWPEPALTFTLGRGDDVWAWAELRVGYFVWLAAHGLLFGIAVWCWRKGSSDPAIVEQEVSHDEFAAITTAQRNAETGPHIEGRCI